MFELAKFIPSARYVSDPYVITIESSTKDEVTCVLTNEKGEQTRCKCKPLRLYRYLSEDDFHLASVSASVDNNVAVKLFERPTGYRVSVICDDTFFKDYVDLKSAIVEFAMLTGRLPIC